eukprot:scaffold14.g1097.t1
MDLLHLPMELGVAAMLTPLAAAQLAAPLAGPLTRGRDVPRPALKGTSLARMEELQQYLKQCDDRATLHKYFKASGLGGRKAGTLATGSGQLRAKRTTRQARHTPPCLPACAVLSTAPREQVAEYARQLKARAAFLAGEEQREYKRAKLLHVMGPPCTLPAAPPPQHSADADAFATGVLAGEEGESDAPGAYATPAVVRARASGADAPQQRSPAAQHATVAAIEAGAAAAASAVLAPSAPHSAGLPIVVSPLRLPPTIADHQLQRIVTPEGAAAAAVAQQLLQPQLLPPGAGRRQTTLPRGGGNK